MNEKERKLYEIQKRKNQVLNELGEKKKRYTVVMDLYIYANDDQHAIQIAEEIAQKERDQWDNQARVMSVHSTPFASTSNNQIYPE